MYRRSSSTVPPPTLSCKSTPFCLTSIESTPSFWKTVTPAPFLASKPKKAHHLVRHKGKPMATETATTTTTKANLVEEVLTLGNLTRHDSEVIVDAVFDAVIGALQRGEKIEVRGFGSFRIRQREPRIGRNPKTGERVDVPAKRVPYFKPSKELRDMVNPANPPKA